MARINSFAGIARAMVCAFCVGACAFVRPPSQHRHLCELPLPSCHRRSASDVRHRLAGRAIRDLEHQLIHVLATESLQATRSERPCPAKREHAFEHPRRQQICLVQSRPQHEGIAILFLGNESLGWSKLLACVLGLLAIQFFRYHCAGYLSAHGSMISPRTRSHVGRRPRRCLKCARWFDTATRSCFLAEHLRHQCSLKVGDRI